MGLGMRIGMIRIELCLNGCLSLLMIATYTSKFGPILVQCFVHLFLLGKCFKTKRKRPRKPRQTRCRPSNVTSLRRCWAACRFVGKKRCCGALTKCRRRVWEEGYDPSYFPLQTWGLVHQRFFPVWEFVLQGFCPPKWIFSFGFWLVWFTPEYLDLLLSTKLAGGASKNGIPRRKRAKKPHGGGSEFGEYTRDVIAVLKQCLNSGASLDQLWTILQSSIPQAQRSGGSKFGKRRTNSWPRKPKVQPNKTGWNEPAPQVKYWTDGLGNARAYTVDSNGWYTWVDSKHAGSPKTPETGQSRSVFSGPQNFLGRDSKWVSGLRLADWECYGFPQNWFPSPKSNLVFAPWVFWWQHLRNLGLSHPWGIIDSLVLFSNKLRPHGFAFLVMPSKRHKAHAMHGCHSPVAVLATNLRILASSKLVKAVAPGFRWAKKLTSPQFLRSSGETWGFPLPVVSEPHF